MVQIRIFVLLLATDTLLVAGIGLSDFILNENIGSGCKKELMTIDLIYQTIEIDNFQGYLKCFFKSEHTSDRQIYIDIYENDKQIHYTILEKKNLLLLPLEYLRDKLSYISLYYVEEDFSCPQRYIHYNIYNLVKSGGVAVSKVLEWQPACFEFPTKTSEVVWPVDTNFQEYCKCTKEELGNKNGCDCPRSKLFEVMMYNDRVCFDKILQHTNQIAIFFQETEIGGCGTDCDLITLLTGHTIDVSSAAPFSFEYNQFNLNPTTIFIAWFEAQCGQQTRYQLIKAEDNSFIPELLGPITSTLVNKTNSTSRYYVKALESDDSLCTTSIVSLQVPKNVDTTLIIIDQSITPVCVLPSSASSAVIMPQEGSNQSCICTNLVNIEYCSCIGNVEFEVFYNSSTDNSLCFNNITRNNTRIHFMSQYFNTLDDRNKGFPLFNQELLDSFNFVVQSIPLPPIILDFINTNNSLCFIDTFNGFLTSITYLINITDITEYTTNIVHDATESNCHQLHYNKQPSYNNGTKFNCGSIKVAVRSKNKIGVSSLTTNIFETGNDGQICNCFSQNVNISLLAHNSTVLELSCSTNYADFYNNTKLFLSIDQNNEIVHDAPVDCLKSTIIPMFTSDIIATIYWMPNTGGQCPVERLTITAYHQDIASKSSMAIIISSVMSTTTLLFAFVIVVIISICLIKRNMRPSFTLHAGNIQGQVQENKIF